MKILLIEDSQVIAAQLAEFLEGQKWQVDYAASGTLGLSLALDTPFDLIILDLGLPDMDGFEVCRQIKSQSPVNIPILMLTARDAFEDKAQGFSLGADDYITKPFEFRELALRCEALTRRQNLYQHQVMTIGDLTLNLTDNTVMRKDEAISVNTTSFKILLTLAQAHPQPVSRTLLAHKIWGDNPPNSDALKSHIYNLRNALDRNYDHKIIKTITNIGYRLALDE